MKLSELTDGQRKVLRALYDAGSAGLTHSQIAAATQRHYPQLNRSSIGGWLNRLDAYGLVVPPEKIGGAWRIHYNGASRFDADPKEAPPENPLEGVDPPCPEPEPQAEPEPAVVKESLTVDPEPEPESDEEDDPEPIPEPDYTPDDLPEFEDLDIAPAHLSQEVIGALEVEIALHHVRAKLAMPLVPARSTRVYRQILECLPEPLIEALRPISELVEGLQ